MAIKRSSRESQIEVAGDEGRKMRIKIPQAAQMVPMMMNLREKREGGISLRRRKERGREVHSLVSPRRQSSLDRSNGVAEKTSNGSSYTVEDIPSTDPPRLLSSDEEGGEGGDG